MNKHILVTTASILALTTGLNACCKFCPLKKKPDKTIEQAKLLVLHKRFYPAIDLADLKHFEHASKQFNVPHPILATVMHLESNGGINNSNRFERHLGTSSIGEFQVLKTTARSMGIAPILLHQTKYNVFAAAKYLRLMYNSCGLNSWACGIKKYNGKGKKAENYLKRAKEFFLKKFGRELK